MTRTYSDKIYSNNFTENNKKICWRLHYNGKNSYLFANGAEILAKDSKQKILKMWHFHYV